MSIFVDTSAWFSSIVPSDPNHLKVVAFLQRNSLPLVTTDYIVDETLTLLRARGEFIKAVTFGRQLLDLQLTVVTFVTPELFTKAWKFFRDQPAVVGALQIARARS